MVANRRALFVGSKQLGLDALQTMVEAIPGRVAAAITLDDAADKRSVLPKFRAYCDSVDLPLSIAKGPSDLTDLVQKYCPYYVLVAGWYWIIKPSLLATVPAGFLGLHQSLLPKYRGSAPLVWAALRGEKQTGVSLFYFDEGIDTGDVVDQVSFALTPHDTITDVLAKAETAAVELVTRYAEPLLSGTAPRRKQDHELASYGSPRRPEDGRISWNQPASEVYNFIRAQTRPYPGAFTNLAEGKVLRIWQASLFPYPYYGVPGLVGQKHRDGFVVACGEGAITIHEWELDGGASMPVDSAVKWGMRLGE
ncbi:MAG TPA: methionyl-tRNA formyltransferase [Pyrinomonadaceae bacterium]